MSDAASVHDGPADVNRPEDRLSASLARGLEACWRRRGLCARLLYPLSLLFRGLVAVRRLGYRQGLLPSRHPGVPVIVVGNISSGGSGKTPFTIWLTRWLQEQGARPGIVIRGYRGESEHWPLAVDADTSPRLAGEEAVLLARATGVPVVAGPVRFDDCTRLLASASVDVIVCDDGLQHYALRRDLEIVLHDDCDHNGWCLPAGPLREPAKRLASVDLVIPTGGDRTPLRQRLDRPRRVADAAIRADTADFIGQRVLAVCGIARPWRFFAMLSEAGLDFDTGVFPDHHRFSPADFAQSGHDVILMTEKDAVKCEPFADERFWYLPLVLEPDPALKSELADRLERLLKSHG